MPMRTPRQVCSHARALGATKRITKSRSCPTERRPRSYFLSGKHRASQAPGTQITSQHPDGSEGDMDEPASYALEGREMVDRIRSASRNTDCNGSIHL